jgi:hypothetical protein
MGYEDEDDKKARWKDQTREATAEYIRKVADEHGLMYVLADIVINPTMASIKYLKHE